MPKRGKKYRAKTADLDTTMVYPMETGIELALKSRYASFDESFDIAVKLGVDPRHADQMVRSTVDLPNGTGKVLRVLVFAKGEKAKEALDAGADYAGGAELLEKIKDGWLEFDKTVATPDMMAEVGKIGRVLGPRNLMPNAKLGTVTFEVGNVVKEIKGGKVDFKVDKSGIVHGLVGKASFGAEKLRENILAFIDRLLQLKPSSSKGIYLQSIALSTTMGAGIKIDPQDVRTVLKKA